MQKLELGHSIEVMVFPPLAITHHWNTGIAFGLLPEYQAEILVINCIIIAFVAIFYFQSTRVSLWGIEALGSGFILGGAIGNLYDRIRYHAVIDFIDIKFWPVFNIADSFICLGAFLIIVYSIFNIASKRPKSTT